ncbi:MAG: 3-deoxy-8-phosphooctulonate synthase [Proteobacteria bacterium]|nr:3-deoxy-8-phosphooctulonate synthase [Pseudomonadota bacterium]
MQTLNVAIQSPQGGEIILGDRKKLTIFCGPCVIESKDHAFKMAAAIKEIAERVGLNLVYKSSYDKANRTSASSFRGLGIEQGLEILNQVKQQFNLPVVTDVHTESDVLLAKEVVSVLQIPAFLCRQTSLLEEAGNTKLPVLIKKGQFVAPQDMKFAAEKIQKTGNTKVLLCERGSCFGYRDLVVDFRSLLLMRELGYPVVFDATHSVQVMGGADGKSSGNSNFVPHLARAAIAVGVDAIFLECHDNPSIAPSDGPNMIELSKLEQLLIDLKNLFELQLNTRN